MFKRVEIMCSFRSLGHWSLMYLKTIELMHWLNLSVRVNQFRISNSLWDICVISSKCRQKRMHFFWEAWILFFNFLVKLGYQAKQAYSKCGWISASQIVSVLELKYSFFRQRNFSLLLILLITKVPLFLQTLFHLECILNIFLWNAVWYIYLHILYLVFWPFLF